jgi:hypothetical protein
MKSILFLILFISLLSFSNTGETKWDFPVKPGTSSWKLLKNNAEKVEACQVPGEVLSTLNTQELLDVCLNYPLLPDIFAFNNIKDGFNKFEDDFNGFRDLLKHDDAPKELLSKYKSIDPEAIPVNGTILGKGNYVLSLSFIELFVSHPLMIGKIETKGKKEVIKELLLKKEKKKYQPDWYQPTGIQTIYLAITSIILSDSDKFKSELDMTKVSPYIYSGILANPDVPNQIDEVTDKYLKNN